MALEAITESGESGLVRFKGGDCGGRRPVQRSPPNQTQERTMALEAVTESAESGSSDLRWGECGRTTVSAGLSRSRPQV